MKFRFREDASLWSFSFVYEVTDAVMVGHPMRVTHVRIEGSRGQIRHVDVCGRRTLKSGAEGTPCHVKVWDWANGPDWLAPIVQDAGERATWG